MLGLLALCALIALATVSSALVLGAAATAIVVAVAWSDTVAARRAEPMNSRLAPGHQ